MLMFKEEHLHKVYTQTDRHSDTHIHTHTHIQKRSHTYVVCTYIRRYLPISQRCLCLLGIHHQPINQPTPQPYGTETWRGGQGEQNKFQ